MVEAISFDAHGSMVAGTLTSRLFMKEPGRVGDSPLPGSDFYADRAIGGAAATRLGEGIMKECLSYRIVALMGSGLSPQEACDSAVYEFDDRLRNRYGKVCEISKVALNKRGEGGGASPPTWNSSSTQPRSASRYAYSWPIRTAKAKHESGQ